MFVVLKKKKKKKPYRLYMSLESRQDVICNWDTASILSSTKWVILGCITSALPDICASRSHLLVPIEKATYNPTLMNYGTLDLSFGWSTLPDFIPNLDVVTGVKQSGHEKKCRSRSFLLTLPIGFRGISSTSSRPVGTL